MVQKLIFVQNIGICAKADTYSVLPLIFHFCSWRVMLPSFTFDREHVLLAPSLSPFYLVSAGIAFIFAIFSCDTAVICDASATLSHNISPAVAIISD